MDRRTFPAGALSASVPVRAGTTLDRSRVSAITDEIAHSPAESIEFAHRYGLKWLSLREVPAEQGAKRAAYHTLDSVGLRQAAREFKEAGIRIAFLDTP